MDSSPCELCGSDIPLSWERCPHCARPGLFPNVRAAQVPAERAALEARYQAALQKAERRGARKVLEDFEAASRGSKAIITRPFRELERLSSSDKELLSTFYQLIQAEVRLPHGTKWDRLRGLADESLFPGSRESIRFAALSLDGAGLPSYGDCSFVLQESMIAHRASVYEENSAVAMKKHAYDPPPGHRATWEERGKLCVAKLGDEVQSTTSPTEFPGLLLQPGVTPEEDRFVEVHLWGPMTIRTMERVAVMAPRKGQKSAYSAIGARLRAIGVTWEVLS
jgi:hypothetical protein